MTEAVAHAFFRVLLLYWSEVSFQFSAAWRRAQSVKITDLPADKPLEDELQDELENDLKTDPGGPTK